MKVALILLLPLLIALVLVKIKSTYRPWVGFGGTLLLLIPILYGASLTNPPSLAVPSLLEANWQFHSYALLGAVAFAIIGAIVLLFTGSSLNRAQVVATCIAISSALGIGYAKSFISLFLFWELLTVSTSLIVLFDKDTDKELGKRFLITHLVGGLSMLFGIMLNYSATGSLAVAMPEQGIVFFLLAIGLKVAFVPLHFWIPATYPRVSPNATVALSIFTTKAGIMVLTRIFSGYGLLTTIGMIMIFFGVFQSLRQGSFRTVLSYLHITQLGFMVVSISFGAVLGVNGSFLHMLNHMVYKTLLFMVTAIVISYYGTDQLTKFTVKPLWLKLYLGVGALAIMGLPPFNGFISKSVIKYAAPPSGQLLMSIATVLTGLSMFRMLYFSVITKTQPLEPKVINIPLERKLAMGMLAGLSLVIGISPSIVGLLTPYPLRTVYSLNGVATSLILAVLGLGMFYFLRNDLKPQHDSAELVSFQPNSVANGLKPLLDKVGGFEEQLTQLSNAQYLLPTFTVVLLISMILIFLDRL